MDTSVDFPHPAPGSDVETDDNIHAAFIGPGDSLLCNYHLGLTGQPCNANGDFLPSGTQPELHQPKPPDDWSPYNSHLEFELADFIYTCNQMSATNPNILLELWATSLVKVGGSPIFSLCKEMYQTIDKTEVGDMKWQSFTVKYTGDVEADPNMLANLVLAEEMDYQPFCEYDTKSSTWWWQEFMSGDWAWHQADIIAQDPDCLRSMFVPIILGSDKTTISMATRQNDYYPLYLSIGNICNNICWAHCDGVILIAFLTMPKSLFHSSLGHILKTFKPGMVKPMVTFFGDGHYWHVIYGLGPYITDYEEQVLLTCIVSRCLAYHSNLDYDNALDHCHDHAEMLIAEFALDVLWNEYGIVGELVPFTNDFLHADIYELITPNLLHQIIKGAFKDHFIRWVEKYFIAAVAPFPGLQHFPQGHHFKQWTDDDSKALMKVYLPVIEGHIPQEIGLDDLNKILARFYQYHEVFKTTGVQPIQLFGAPNGLCLSIPESKHVKAVKNLYWHTNKYHALGQMLLINQCSDKLWLSNEDKDDESEYPLASASIDESRGDYEDVNGPRVEAHWNWAVTIVTLVDELNIPNLPELVRAFLWKYIHTVPMWRQEGPHYDCAFIITDPELEGMHGMDIACILCFFSFKTRCAIIFTCNHQCNLAVIHVDTIFHAAHLIPIYGQDFILQEISPCHSYDTFCGFYVNKFADHHAFEIAY
ncbi:hypothetical protein EDC04DRAFT_2865210 [Pisolithus marmoratus]|nr:hypothetical protein EDC04DRAFT_2865210 [Pisolithus marmoratus]